MYFLYKLTAKDKWRYDYGERTNVNDIEMKIITAFNNQSECARVCADLNKKCTNELGSQKERYGYAKYNTSDYE